MAWRNSAKWSRRWWAQRTARAPIVLVGLIEALVTTELPSQMYRLGTSQLWCHLLVTELAGSSPMRQVPSRCQAGGW